MNQRPNMDLAKIVLHELKRRPLYRTELEKLTTQKAGSHAAFENIFRYLIHNGHVQKSSQNHRAKYVITDKGLMLLKAIEEPLY